MSSRAFHRQLFVASVSVSVSLGWVLDVVSDYVRQNATVNKQGNSIHRITQPNCTSMAVIAGLYRSGELGFYGFGDTLEPVFDLRPGVRTMKRDKRCYGTVLDDYSDFIRHLKV